ncbi:uncharacterized protein T551_03404 [Pneumocystis jirovecii RU7]|uniref:Major surface glycoprotein 2 C-terminal domain-containing protein n=1 Tax=Pneumocystis jirovecii (strain RU7) TaxID=1408657 RepID=A0A0W4ZDT8_PNEJ7|nr:uncharacterized protein T551_03404 [Pneumocystis jirovecii RU7]KTW26487.1 hypothetical protein T551_03404 [Pneumocystis jirovecii RU7]
MKVFILTFFLGIVHASSKNIEFIHKKSTLDQLLDRSLYSITKERIFALILKENAINNHCHEKLKEYCEDLEKIGLNLNNYHFKLNELCEKSKMSEKCINLGENIKKSCDILKHALTDAIKKPSATNEDCEMETECMFWEGVSPEELTEKCNNLRIICRKRKRHNLTKKFLLRVFNENIKTVETCKQVINEKCHVFMKESDELMQFCLSPLNRCRDLIHFMKDEYTELKINIEQFFKNPKISEEKCNFLLDECYFYGSNYNNNLQDICKELEKKCKKKVKYIPPSSTFNPIGKDFTLMEKVKKKKLFRDEIGKPRMKDMIDLLVLMVNNDLEDCKTYVERCYEFCSSLPQLKNLYDNTKKKISENKEEICTNLKDTLKPRCKALKLELYSLSLSDTTDDNKETTLLKWTEQFTEFDEELCTELESKCFYYRRPCNLENIKLNNACGNVNSACLKTRLLKREYQLLQNKLTGKLHNLMINDALKTCVNELLNLCKENVDIKEPLLADLCLHPKNTCQMLAKDIEKQSQELNKNLNKKKDSINEEDCMELEEKCKILGQDSRINEFLCLELNKKCDHLKNTKELEEILIKEKTEKLYDLHTCIKKMTERCNNWPKKTKTLFTISCIQVNITCRIIIEDVKFKCNTLRKNMNIMKISEKIKTKDINIKKQICDFWEPYCDKFMLSCKGLIQNDSKDGKCEELKENCKSYQEPSEGLRMNGWSIIKETILGVIISLVI